MWQRLKVEILAFMMCLPYYIQSEFYEMVTSGVLSTVG